MMGAVRKILAHEGSIVGALILIFVIANLSQTLAYIAITPQGFVFPLVHNYVEDYYYYLHLMRQGYDGMWLATSRLTPEIFPPVFVNPFFLLLGHIARIGGITLPAMYTLARAMGGIGVIGGTYLLVRIVFPESGLKRITALILTFTSTYFWGWGSQGPTVAPLVHDWTELDPLFRLSYIPHHLWSKVFMMLTFLIYLRLLNTGQKKYLVAACVATLVAGFISPVVLATMLPMIAIWFFIELESHWKKILTLSQLTSWGALFGSMLFVALYHRFVQQGVFPWTSYLSWEKVQYLVTPLGYLQSLGPNFFLFVIGIPILLKKKFLGSFLLAWAVTSWVTLFLLAPYIPLTNSRYLGGYQFIPLGIGASMTFFWISERLYLHGNMLTRCIVPLFVLFLLLFNGVGIWLSWKEHVGYVASNRWNAQVFVPNDVIGAFAYLSKEAGGDVVVAPLEISTMIPAFTGSRVISGHKTITYEYDAKNRELASFFSHQNLTQDREFLLKYHAQYVLAYGPEQSAVVMYKDLGLTLVYNNPTVTIFRVP